MKENPSILIVDDHRPTAKSLAAKLQDSKPNWEIQTAFGVQDAIDLLTARDFDAVVSDFKLDDHDVGKTGLKVIDEANRKDPLCVTILMTAFPEEFDRYKDAFRAGLDDCIVKTQKGVVVSDEIAVKLELALAKRWKHEEAYFYARHIDHQLRDELGATSKKSKLSPRTLAIMFTDVRGFSQVTNELRTHTPVVVTFLERLYSTIVEIVHRSDGIVDKFIGDGSMCLFGLRGSKGIDNHAINAVRAAMQLQKMWPELESAFRAESLKHYGQKLSPMSLGVGINLEEVMTGIVKTEHRDQYTAIGNGVNIAKKLESLAGRPQRDGDSKSRKNAQPHVFGHTLITGPIESKVRDHFNLIEEPEIKILDKPYQIWKVLGEK